MNERKKTHHKHHRAAVPMRAIAIVLGLLGLIGAACGSHDDAQSRADTATSLNQGVGDAVADSFDVGVDAIDFESAATRVGTDEMAEAEMAEAEMAEDDSDTAGAFGGSAVPVGAQLPDIGRDIIYTAQIDLAATDLSAATRDAVEAVQSRGGFLFSQNTVGGVGGASRLVFKIFPEQFQAALDDLGSLGSVRSQSISAEDVSALVVDLQSRINTAEASVTRLRDLLDGAATIDNIAQIENQLLARETALEQLRGQLRSVQGRVDLATITVTISEIRNQPRLQLSTRILGEHDGGFACTNTSTWRRAVEGDPITICVEIGNSGDTVLADLRFVDAVLGAQVNDMIVVEGDPSAINVGDRLLLAYEIEAGDSLNERIQVQATGRDLQGNALDDEVTGVSTLRLVVDERDGRPGFGETLRSSWNGLTATVTWAGLILVGLAPFLIVALALAWPARWALARFRAKRRSRLKNPEGTTNDSPPPTRASTSGSGEPGGDSDDTE